MLANSAAIFYFNYSAFTIFLHILDTFFNLLYLVPTYKLCIFYCILLISDNTVSTNCFVFSILMSFFVVEVIRVELAFSKRCSPILESSIRLSVFDDSNIYLRGARE